MRIFSAMRAMDTGRTWKQRGGGGGGLHVAWLRKKLHEEDSEWMGNAGDQREARLQQAAAKAASHNQSELTSTTCFSNSKMGEMLVMRT
jgi:hypothetical protein